jgi:hypothetical protein
MSDASRPPTSVHVIEGIGFTVNPSAMVAPQAARATVLVLV